MANLRQIPSILRGNDSAGYAAKEILPLVKRTDDFGCARRTCGTAKMEERDLQRLGLLGAGCRRQGILILNEIVARQR